MAGSFAKIFNRVWGDADFRSLTHGQQWLLWTISSQQEMSFAGVLTTTPRRVAGCAEDVTAAQFEADLKALEARGYVLVDEDHDEILVCNYVTDDGAWRTPNTLLSISRDAGAVRSPRLRAALAEEFARLDAASLDGKKADEMRAVLARVIASLRPTPPDRPAQPMPEPMTQPIGQGLAHGLQGPMPEGLRHGSPEGSGEPMAQDIVVVAVVVEEVEDRTSVKTVVPPSAGAEAPHLRAVPDPPKTTDELIGDWIDHVPKRPPGQVIALVGKHIKAMLGEGIDPADVRRGIASWAQKGLNPSALPSVVNEVMNAQPAADPRFAPGSGARLDPNATYTDDPAEVFGS